MNRTQLLDSVIKQASPIEIEQGKIWYTEAHEFCKELSKQFNVSLDKICGIVAALSPQKRWDLNKKIAHDYLMGKRNIHTNVQVSKCDWIMRGDDIEQCLGGMKTINFFHNILDPKDDQWFTIDRWILNIFKEGPKVTPKQYNTLKQLCINYSAQTPWVSPEVQAIAWVVVRGKAD